MDMNQSQKWHATRARNLAAQREQERQADREQLQEMFPDGLTLTGDDLRYLVFTGGGTR